MARLLARITRSIALLTLSGAVLRPKEGAYQPMGTLVTEDDISRHGAFARQMIGARRLITQYFDADLFADPAMDILLDLYAAAEENKKVCTSSACIAAAVPSTTALRWIARLKAAHLIEERPDPADGRRKWLTLTPKAHARMTAFLEKINPGIVPPKAN